MALKNLFHDPLLDATFLKKLTEQHNKIIYAKILALTFEEEPIDEIQGHISQGSVSIDGNSLVRRTCSLTLAAEDLNINEYLWGLKTKIKLYIGLENSIEPNYPEIIWFNMGLYVLTSFNVSLAANGYTVSLQGKDKMCLLNGDVGGNLTALSYDFGQLLQLDQYGNQSQIQLELEKIILEAVHEYGKEPYHNIIINDLEDCGLELLEYRGKDPLILVYNIKTQEIENIVLHLDQTEYATYDKDTQQLIINTVEYFLNQDNIKLKSLANITEEDQSATIFYVPDVDIDQLKTSNQYQLIKIEYGMTCGYRETPLVYAGQLTASVGDPITKILSAIVSMLGNYEFYYNLDGQFVFQRKRTYVDVAWNNIRTNQDEKWVDSAAYSSSYMFSFEDGNLVTSFQNTPDFANVKNDFSIWGVRKGVSGADIPIHLRYAIDKKPQYYTNYENTCTYTTKTPIEVAADQRLYSETTFSIMGFSREKSTIGLTEDWWEFNEWKAAWAYCQQTMPDVDIDHCCPKKVQLTTDKHFNFAQLPSNLDISNVEPYYISEELLQQWSGGTALPEKAAVAFTGPIDNIIFSKDGLFIDTHGYCDHTVQYWETKLQSEDIIVYLYKPILPNNINYLQYNQDWRELIYQMSKDYFRYGTNTDFIATIKKNNSFFYPNGYTGYEQYYTDINSFWRQLYDPDYICSYTPIALTEQQYIDEAKNETLYFDSPIYKLCDPTVDPYAENCIYYQKFINVFRPVQLSQYDFIYPKPGKVYYYNVGTAENPQYEKCGSNAYSEDLIYYQHYDELYEPVTVSQREYLNPTIDNGYWIVTEMKKVPISQTNHMLQIIPFESNQQYFSYDNGVLTPFTFPTQEHEVAYKAYYNANAQNLYLREDYLEKRNCLSFRSFETGTTYYTYENNNYVAHLDLTQQKYKEDPIGTYYIVKSGFNSPRRIEENKDNHMIAAWVAPYYFSLSTLLSQLNQYGAKYEFLIFKLQTNLFSDTGVLYYDANNTAKAIIPETGFLDELQGLWSDELAQVLTSLPESEQAELKKNINSKYADQLLEELKTTYLRMVYDRQVAYYTIPTSRYIPCLYPIIDFDEETSYYTIGEAEYYVDDTDVTHQYWNKMVYETPENLNFWFDFLDADGALSAYSVPNIGARPKAVNDKDVKAIYFRETPQVIFTESTNSTLNKNNERKTGYVYLTIPSHLQSLFTISAQGKSAKTALDNLLYINSYCAESVSLSTVPIYFLEPNTRIFVDDKKSKINGEYIVTRLSIPLSANGTMSISATKVVDRIY